MSSLPGRAERVLLSNYFPPQLSLVRGEGSRVFDEAGKAYVDLIGGIAVNSLGHCHPAVVEAIRRQCGTLMHISNLYQHPLQVRLAEELAGHYPGGRFFFCNSGAEANEAAIKLVRRWGRQQSPGRHVIVTAEGSFHGRTTGALAATGQEQYRRDFEPLLPGFRYVPYGDDAALDGAVGDDTCAVMLEPIQGEGGVVVPPAGYLARAAALCRERGALLVYDEVQTGFGRTGPLFAWQHDGVVPDVITLSKAMGGGLPLGATGARGSAAEAFVPGSHASTFGGNPVACAAALAVLETILDEDFRRKKDALAAFFKKGLEELAAALPVVKEVRGRGLLLALELAVEAKPVVADALAQGYLINAVQQRTLRFAPPFIVTEEEVAAFLAVLEEILRGQS